MGFETAENMKRLQKDGSFELCPYGIWNVGRKQIEENGFVIWTLSLWDLKHNSGQSITVRQ